MSIRSLCNTTATVVKATRTNDTHGGFVLTSDVVYSGVPCRIQPLSGREQIQYRRENVNVTTKMYVPGDNYSSINGDCRVKDAGGKWYDVEFVADIDLLNHHLEIAMQEIRDDL